jgi:hypothetical protein
LKTATGTASTPAGIGYPVLPVAVCVASTTTTVATGAVTTGVACTAAAAGIKSAGTSNIVADTSASIAALAIGCCLPYRASTTTSSSCARSCSVIIKRSTTIIALATCTTTWTLGAANASAPFSATRTPVTAAIVRILAYATTTTTQSGDGIETGVPPVAPATVISASWRTGTTTADNDVVRCKSCNCKSTRGKVATGTAAAAAPCTTATTAANHKVTHRCDTGRRGKGTVRCEGMHNIAAHIGGRTSTGAIRKDYGRVNSQYHCHYHKTHISMKYRHLIIYSTHSRNFLSDR